MLCYEVGLQFILSLYTICSVDQDFMAEGSKPVLEIKDTSRDKLYMTAIKGDTVESEILMGKRKVAIPLLLLLFLFCFVNFVRCKMNFYADHDFEVNSVLLLSIGYFKLLYICWFIFLKKS